MNKAVKFHGHSCPGLAIGVQAANYILDHGNDFSIDEELVAVVENDNCSVDALQALLGTTFGKGNLIYLDYGKNNYTFYNRIREKAVKLIFKDADFSDSEMSREDRKEKILSSNYEDIFDIRNIDYNPPDKATIYKSLICDRCGQPTMETRTIRYKKETLCIPCHKEATGGK